ncbi:MAG: anti-sigma factor family protein [Elusimicrobiota bacterium]
MRNCEDVFERLYEYINARDLDSAAVEDIRGHLALCRRCYEVYEFERRLVARLQESGACPCPETLKRKIAAFLQI